MKERTFLITYNVTSFLTFRCEDQSPTVHEDRIKGCNETHARHLLISFYERKEGIHLVEITSVVEVTEENKKLSNSDDGLESDKTNGE